MNFWLELIICLFLLTGSVFALIGSFALFRLPDYFMRLHGPTKATTLGVGGIIIASLLFFSFHDGRLSLHELLIAVFLFLTAPISAHMLAKTAIQQKLRAIEKTKSQDWKP